ncbi:sugar-binding protein, partial [Candidatus Magnetomorum sp. HK-1]
VTQYVYNEKERISKVIYPNKATKITSRHIDGKVKSITGASVIAKYYDYGINPDGSTWTKVYTGKTDSLQWEKTTSDTVGREYLTEKPGPKSTIEIRQHYYNQRGQLIKTTTTDLADTLYTYNMMGERLRSGLDINDNGILDPESDDRINESNTQYVHIDENWWDETIQKVYAKKDGAAQTTTQTQRTRMTGFSDTLTAENISISIKGEETLSTVLINRSKKTETHMTNNPDAENVQISQSINGLLMSTTSKSGVNVIYQYDALGRKIYESDERVGNKMHYNSKGWIDYVENKEGHRKSYDYDPETGKKTKETSELGKVTHFAYNDLNQITHQWGNADYPVQYVYDPKDYGQSKNSPKQKIRKQTHCHYDP